MLLFPGRLVGRELLHPALHRGGRDEHHMRPSEPQALLGGQQLAHEGLQMVQEGVDGLRVGAGGDEEPAILGLIQILI